MEEFAEFVLEIIEDLLAAYSKKRPAKAALCQLILAGMVLLSGLSLALYYMYKENTENAVVCGVLFGGMALWFLARGIHHHRKRSAVK